MPTLTELLGIAGGIPYWVSGTNYAQGKTVRSPTDHQLYVRIVAGGGAADPANDPGNWRPDGGRAIKQIQRGVVTFSLNEISKNVTISAVNTAKTELRWLGGVGFEAGTSVPMGSRVVLSNSTTLTVAFNSVVAGNPSVSWELTEYY